MGKLKSGMKSLFKIASNTVQGIEQGVPIEIEKERKSICAKCPQLNATTNQCKECGCFINAKTKFRQERCPLDKWIEWEDTK